MPIFPFAPTTALALLSERAASPRLPVPHAAYNFSSTNSSSNSSSPSPSSNYTLVDLFNAQNFFSEFAFFNGPSDPTHGFVQYVSDYQTATDTGLVGYAPDGVMLGVHYINKYISSSFSSSKNAASPHGRPSVRVTFKKTYTEGLFIADIYHMPSGLYDHDDDGTYKSSRDDSSSCGLWPAFWTFGPNWPASGEIDILEGVNTQSTNSITLHTSGTKSTKKGSEGGGTCNISSTGSSASDTKLADADCASNTGCKQDTTTGHGSSDGGVGKNGTGNNYRVGFNKGGGGIYAVEWWSSSDVVVVGSGDGGGNHDSSSGDGGGENKDKGGGSTGFIKVWFFPRGSDLATKLAGNTTTTTTTTTRGIASSYSSSSSKNMTAGGVVSSATPGADPSNFGTPLAAFVFDRGCSLRDHFKNHSIVFNTAFCGDWAGAVWDKNPTCKGLAKKCEDYVGANPGQFKEAYWVVNSIKVYQRHGRKS
ncbi:concanavalin A-like lectin/glucanase domain-containing protein [Neurospora tetraspora]|uniref:Concanavalin A-like lectin/glucanase domain-containing protein n=1 Tax=Neurospora tetraspora TaxID=94610 RepID=A0AAE0J0T0_9PEZI|nr:concanavalin A-like lectin/glucanase domain-containing protein [Neurospora tetraspora]